MPLRKIYLITNYTPDGGVNTMFKEAYSFFKKKDFEIIVYFFVNSNSNINTNSYDFIDSEIRIHSVVTNIESYKFFKKLHIKNFDKKKDLIFSISGTILMNTSLRNYFKANFFAWVATPYFEEKISLIKKKGLIQKFFFYFIEIPICVLLEKYLTKKIDMKVISLSNYTKDKFAIKGAKVLNCPISELKLKNKSKKGTKSFNLFFSGRLSDPRKNINLFLKIANLFKLKKYKNINFFLVGGKVSDHNLLYIKKNSLTNVTILPYMEKKSLYNFYKKMDIFIITSFQEGLCISAIEAITFGCPVVSSKCGGVSDVIENNYNGFFADYDENDYMNKILKIIKTPDSYNFFSKNSIEKSKKFSFNYFSNSLERLIKI